MHKRTIKNKTSRIPAGEQKRKKKKTTLFSRKKTLCAKKETSCPTAPLFLKSLPLLY